MKKKCYLKPFAAGAFYLCLAISVISCGTATRLRYFSDLPDSTTIHLPPMPQIERVVQPGDRLQITFGGKDEEAAAFFNKYGGIATSGINSSAGSSANQGNSELSGYLIDLQGMIEFPIIGKVKAEGLTSQQLKDTLTSLVNPYLKEPLVLVRFMSFKFTVLGEVRAPGTFSLPMQRTTILEALGAAGDLPRSAKRDDIEIYRDYNGQRIITKIDLRRKNILYNSDAFIIRHNDVIYVQPRESRVFNEEARFYTGLLSIFIGIATLVVAISK